MTSTKLSNSNNSIGSEAGMASGGHVWGSGGIGGSGGDCEENGGFQGGVAAGRSSEKEGEPWTGNEERNGSEEDSSRFRFARLRLLQERIQAQLQVRVDEEETDVPLLLY